MSDHADVIRECIWRAPGVWHPEALAALDALVAERDEALRDVDRMSKFGGVELINQEWAELREIAEARREAVPRVSELIFKALASFDAVQSRADITEARAEAAEAERDEARAERDHWSKSALADRTRTAEARVTELEAALTEAIGWIIGWFFLEEPHDDLRLRFIDELRAVLAPTKEDTDE